MLLMIYSEMKLDIGKRYKGQVTFVLMKMKVKVITMHHHTCTWMNLYTLSLKKSQSKNLTLGYALSYIGSKTGKTDFPC